MQNNTILNCDLLTGFAGIPDNSIDLCMTSPPYNCGIKYDVCKDDKPWEDYLLWCKTWLTEMKRVLKPDGRFAINHLVEMGIPANGKKNGLRVSPQVELYKILTELDLVVSAQPMWADLTKSTLTCWGSWQSASAPYIYNPYEVILIGYKTTWKKERPKESPGINTISKEDFMKAVGGIWNIQPETKGLTMACFPVALPKMCIELLTFKGDVVLDPFMGSGSTAVACVETERVYMGFELSPDYHKIAEDRVNNYIRTGNKTLPTIKNKLNKKNKKTSSSSTIDSLFTFS